MEFDHQNPVVRLCAEGMEQEGLGNRDAAAALFARAWEQSITDFDKFTAAHYVARHQQHAEEKLKWDELALQHALLLKDESIKGAFPSLYLNIAKCHEDLGDKEKARACYELADTFTNHLPDDGYGNMIRAGIRNGIQRVS